MGFWGFGGRIYPRTSLPSSICSTPAIQHGIRSLPIWNEDTVLHILRLNVSILTTYHMHTLPPSISTPNIPSPGSMARINLHVCLPPSLLCPRGIQMLPPFAVTAESTGMCGQSGRAYMVGLPA